MAATRRIMRPPQRSHQESSPRGGKVPLGSADITEEGIGALWAGSSSHYVLSTGVQSDRPRKRPRLGRSAPRAFCLPVACWSAAVANRDWCVLRIHHPRSLLTRCQVLRQLRSAPLLSH